MQTKNYDENAIAEQIVSALPAGIARQFSAERDTIRYAVRGEGLKLRTIVLSRESLRRLAEDPLREIKVEYLQRDLTRSAAQSSEFRYPRPHVMPKLPRGFRFALPMASVF